MKKWLILPIVAIVGVVAIRQSKNTFGEAASVRTTVLETQQVEQTVSCNGVVEAGEIRAVFAGQACVVDEVLVSVGQRVKKGDTLITVNKEATKALQMSDERLMNALSLSVMDESVVAPVDGIILSVDATDGVPVDATAPCVTIAPTEKMQVRVLIREKQLPSLDVGQTARVSGSGFDKSVYCGRLEEISGAASTSSGGEGIVEGVVKLDGNEADDSLRIGLSAKVKIVISTLDDALLIPYEAVVNDDDGESYAYVVENGETKRQTIHSLGEQTGGLLVEHADWFGKTVVLEPDRVSGEGEAVSAVRGDAE